jgi:hypothetical protein
MIRFPTVLPVAGFMQAAALEELGSRDAQLSAQKAALEERGAELEAWAAQVSQGSGFRVQGPQQTPLLEWMQVGREYA